MDSSQIPALIKSGVLLSETFAGRKFREFRELVIHLRN